MNDAEAMKGITAMLDLYLRGELVAVDTLHAIVSIAGAAAVTRGLTA